MWLYRAVLDGDISARTFNEQLAVWKHIYPANYRRFLHQYDGGIVREPDENCRRYCSGSILLKYQEVDPEVDYTRVDKFKWNGKTCSVGKREPEECSEIDCDVEYSGMRTTTSTWRTFNGYLEELPAPWLVLVQTIKNLYVLGFHSVEEVEDIELPDFDRKFKMRKL